MCWGLNRLLDQRMAEANSTPTKIADLAIHAITHMAGEFLFRDPADLRSQGDRGFQLQTGSGRRNIFQ